MTSPDAVIFCVAAHPGEGLTGRQKDARSPEKLIFMPPQYPLLKS
jgi:hypothetical protein